MREVRRHKTNHRRHRRAHAGAQNSRAPRPAFYRTTLGPGSSPSSNGVVRRLTTPLDGSTSHEPGPLGGNLLGPRTLTHPNVGRAPVSSPFEDPLVPEPHRARKSRLLGAPPVPVPDMLPELAAQSAYARVTAERHEGPDRDSGPSPSFWQGVTGLAQQTLSWLNPRTPGRWQDSREQTPASSRERLSA
jgi:hypothetical protein